MIISRLEKHEWAPMEKDAHFICFSEILEHDLKYDFVLIAKDEAGTLCSYITCRELDSESVYIQYGGTIPKFRGTGVSQKAMDGFMDYHKKHYKRASTFVQNDNFPMLKLAMKVNFKINGLRYFNDHILLEHLVEFEKGE